MPEKLLQEGIFALKMKESLGKMLGFRNRAIHNYPSLDVKQVFDVLQNDIGDFKDFLEIAKSYLS
ncbi:MAG: DUF86 domain-containing protein [bacterium]|nr:DUF86 domain-containing protein [bacterium]